MISQRHFKQLSRWALPAFAHAFLFFCTLIFTLSCLSSAALAAEPVKIELTPKEQAWLAEHPDISLGAPTTFPPFVIKRNDGTYVGMMVDFMEAASRLLNHRIRLHIEDPWAKVQERAKNREIDGLSLGARSPHRAVHFRETDTVFNTYYSIFARSRDEYQITQLSDLDGMRIGTREGGVARDFRGEIPSAEFKYYGTNEALTKALLSKEVDVVLSWISYDFFRKDKLQGTIDNILLVEEYPMDMVIHIRKDWPELVSIMNKVIAVMKQEELPRIMKKWFLEWPKKSAKVSRVNLTPEERAWLNAHPDITLGTSASYPPHIVTNPDGTYTGVLPDVYEQISQLLGTKVNVEVGKVWSEVQKKAENRELDGLAIGGRDPQRDKLYTATDRLYPAYFSVFASSKKDLTIGSFKDLDGLRIGYKRGARPAKTRLEMLPSATIVPFDSHESMTQALLSNDIDVIVAWMSYDHWRKNTLQGTIDKIYLITETPFDMVIYIRNDWPEFVPIMNKALAVMQKGSLPNIINKWFGEWPQQSSSDSSEPSIGRTELQIDYKRLLSEEERAWLAQRHTVKARVSSYPPLMFQEPEISGLSLDYLKTISERFGFKVEFIPNKEGFALELEDFMAGNSPYDLFLTLNPTPEREAKVSFTDIYLSMPWVIYNRDDTEFISGMESLDGKTVAVEEGFVMVGLLEKGYPQINLHKVPTSLDALRAVATSQVDAYIGNLSNATWLIQEHNLDNLEIAAPSPFGNHDNAMGVRRDWPELASIISKGLASMTPEEHSTIKNRWHSVTYTSKTDYTLLWQVLLAIGLVIVGIIYWNRLLRQQVRKRTADLSESEARFRATFEQAAVGIAHVSPEGNFLRLNQKFCDIVGYSQKELLALTFQDITHPDDLDMDLGLLQELLDGKNDSYSLEKRYLRKDGLTVWVNLTVKVLRRNDGSPRWFVSVIENISDRVRAEDQLRKSYEFLNHLTQTLPDAIFSVKLPERTVNWCTDTYGVLGYKPQECIGETTAMFYPSTEDEAAMGSLLENAIRDNTDLAQTEVKLRRKDGGIFPAEVKLAFLKEDDHVIGVTALLRDISERKQAEKDLQQSHDFLEYILSSIPEAVFYVKLPERVIAWTNDSYNIMGLGENIEHLKGLSTEGFFASK
ncbi:MAG: transporter substrate-binding domain-containing protein, partial [Deltaproteobacteria bacterium]|nr:transporter substrate-binding domain-containing protein [Deltaproteobacteria bacterium]